MLALLILLLQTPSAPYAELWIPECKEQLSVAGPSGYRECARVAVRTRKTQLGLREGEYRSLLEDAERTEDLARFDADTARFESYSNQHCGFVANANGRNSVLADNRALSCRYHLNDRRIAELDTMIVMFLPVMSGP